MRFLLLPLLWLMACAQIQVHQRSEATPDFPNSWSESARRAAPSPKLPSGEAVTDRLSVLVVPLNAVGVPLEVAQVFTAELRSHVGNDRRVTLVVPEEMGAIDKEVERHLDGSCSDASCMVELGNALGARLILAGQLGRLGSRYTLNLKLIDVEKVTALTTANLSAQRLEDLQDQLRAKVLTLLSF
jgi:TolB-like protein